MNLEVIMSFKLKLILAHSLFIFFAAHAAEGQGKGGPSNFPAQRLKTAHSFALSPQDLALFDAIAHNHYPAIVRLLCFEGASLNACNGVGVTALHKAVEGGNPRTVYLLLNFRILFDLARKWFPEKGRPHLQSIANIDSRSACGWTPLHIAAYQGNPEIVAMLLDYCANPYAQTRDEKKPIDVAANKIVRDMLVEAEMHNLTLFPKKGYLPPSRL